MRLSLMTPEERFLFDLNGYLVVKERVMRKVARFGGCGTVSPQACADASLLRYRPRKSVFTSDEVSAFNASIDAHKDAFKERTGDLRNSKLHTPLAGDGPSAL